VYFLFLPRLLTRFCYVCNVCCTVALTAVNTLQTSLFLLLDVDKLESSSLTCWMYVDVDVLARMTIVFWSTPHSRGPVVSLFRRSIVLTPVFIHAQLSTLLEPPPPTFYLSFSVRLLVLYPTWLTELLCLWHTYQKLVPKTRTKNCYHKLARK